VRVLFITRRFAPDARGAVASLAAQVYRDARLHHEVQAVVGYVRDRALVPADALGVDLCGRRGVTATLALRRASVRAARTHDPEVIVTTELDAPRSRRPAVAVLVRPPERGSPATRLAVLRARAFAHVVVPAPQVKRAFVALGLAEERITVVPPGLDGDALNPRLRGAGPALRLACVGRIAPDKAQHLAIDAVSRLAPADKARVHLQVVGTVADKVYLEQLRVQAWRQPVSFHLEVDDVASFYRDADLVLAPRLLNPTFRFAAAEAMTAGTPVAWSDHPDTREILGDHGVAVSPGDVEALRAAIQDMLRDPQPFIDDAAAGRLRVLERCGRDVVWRQLDAVLRRAVG
jgi:glycosyltransferase involved in cell wall biosynthesis